MYQPQTNWQHPTPSANSEAAFNYGLIATFVGFAVYSVMVSLQMLAGRVPLDRAFLLMMPLPLGTALWQLAAFFRVWIGRDWGLLVSALGWMGVVLALGTYQVAAMRLSSQGLGVSELTTPAFFGFLLLWSLTLLVVGAILSFTYWRNLHQDPDEQI